MKDVSIKITKDNVPKIDLIFLNAYALKKYMTLYDENKSKVNADIRALAKVHDLKNTRDITMILVSELMTSSKRKEYILEYKKSLKKQQ